LCSSLEGEDEIRPAAIGPALTHDRPFFCDLRLLGIGDPARSDLVADDDRAGGHRHWRFTHRPLLPIADLGDEFSDGTRTIVRCGGACCER
jgi:hypothetical protein